MCIMKERTCPKRSLGSKNPIGDARACVYVCVCVCVFAPSVHFKSFQKRCRPVLCLCE